MDELIAVMRALVGDLAMGGALPRWKADMLWEQLAAIEQQTPAKEGDQHDT